MGQVVSGRTTAAERAEAWPAGGGYCCELGALTDDPEHCNDERGHDTDTYYRAGWIGTDDGIRVLPWSPTDLIDAGAWIRLDGSLDLVGLPPNPYESLP